VIRAFIAIDLPEPVRAALAEAQGRLRHAPLGVKISWSNPANLHLTLQFLGDVPAERVPVISAGLAQVAGAVAPFEVELAGVGGFPDLRRPRVIWVGCRDETGRLRELATRVRGLGWRAEEHEFTPHLTLGRVKTPRPDGALTRALDCLTRRSFGTMRVEAVHLFQSQLHPHGAVYTTLSSHTLGGERDHAGQTGNEREGSRVEG
jgi:2'-5' RNA ligase